MRSPVIAFSIFAAATVGPSLVSGAPAAPAPPLPDTKGLTGHLPVVGGGLGSLPTGPNNHVGRAFQDPTDAPTPPSSSTVEGFQATDGKKHKKTHHHSRANNDKTAGGNAFSGGTSDSSGGTIVNENEDDATTLTNTNASEYTHLITFFCGANFPQRHRWCSWRL